jgi:hypothetical protein
LKPGFLAARFLISASPHIIKGMDKTNQNPAHGAGRIPSDICIACAVPGKKQIIKNAREPTIIFLSNLEFVIIIISLKYLIFFCHIFNMTPLFS